MKSSPQAARELLEIVGEGDFSEAEDLMGQTDCPEGCYVEPDGTCPHGWRSAGLSAGIL